MAVPEKSQQLGNDELKPLAYSYLLAKVVFCFQLLGW